MKKIGLAFGLLTILGLAALSIQDQIAWAQYTDAGAEMTNLGVLIDGENLNTATAFTLSAERLRRHRFLTLFVNFTRSAATDVQMTCDVSPDSQTTWFKPQSCAVSAGNCTSTDATWTRTISASDTFVWRVDMAGLQDARCTFTGTSAAFADKITVTGFGATN